MYLEGLGEQCFEIDLDASRSQLSLFAPTDIEQIEHEPLESTRFVSDPLRGFSGATAKPIHARHLDIEQDAVWPLCLEDRDRFLARGGDETA